MTKAQETFARALAAGRSQADALREAYPNARRWSAGSLYPRASRLAKSPRIAAKVAELRKAAATGVPGVEAGPIDKGARPSTPAAATPANPSPSLPPRLSSVLAWVEARCAIHRGEALALASCWRGGIPHEDAEAVAAAWAARHGESP